MKDKIRIIFLCFAHTILMYGLDEHTSQTFMFTRPVFNSISINQASWHDFGYERKKNGSNVQVYPIYAQSFDTSTGPQYFLFNNLNHATIRGGQDPTTINLTPQGYVVDNPQQDDTMTQSLNRDILGQWLDHNTISSSTFTLNPFQRQACAVLEFNQKLKHLFDASLFDLWYLSVRLPVTYISNNIGFRGDQSALDAFSNKNFRHANITTTDKTSTRLSNIELTLGTEYLNENDLMIITGFGLTVPFVEQGSNTCLFEAVHGFNSHFVMNAQGIFQFPIVASNDYRSRICYFLEFENNFLARDFQYRTFDLKNKPYSRYMKLLDIKTNSTVPAMNVLTVRSKVEPFNIFNMATGVRVKYDCASIEIGYELWAHGSEEITLEPSHVNDWEDDRYGIAFINEDGALAKISGTSIVALTTGETGQTSSNSTINYIAPPDGITDCCPDPTFTQKNKYITLKDIDTNSGASRSALTHRAYMTIGFGTKDKKKNLFGNLGLYIEAAHNNGSLSMWGGWAKLGVSF